MLKSPLVSAEVSMAASEGTIFIGIRKDCEMVLRTLSLLEARSVPLVCLQGFGISSSWKMNALRVLRVK
jgi:hypothetical protein